MGTNYHWRDLICDGCGRYREVHVGKLSGGWSFIFRAWPHRLMDEDHPEWGYEPESPFGFAVMSRADWRRVFRDAPFGRVGELWDQYGKKVDDPVGWLDGLVPPDADKRTWEDDHTRSRYFPEPYQRDPEGFRVSADEFS